MVLSWMVLSWVVLSWVLSGARQPRRTLILTTAVLLRTLRLPAYFTLTRYVPVLSNAASLTTALPFFS